MKENVEKKEHKKIMEMRQYICKVCMAQDDCKLDRVSPCVSCKELSKALVNAGYHKQVWHKVADGDLPPANTDVLCFGKLRGTRQKAYDLNVYSYVERCWYGFGFRTDEIDEVIAWTELPKYEGGNE